MTRILVVNNYGQFTHLIHRAIRDLEVDTDIIPNTLTPQEVMEEEPDGLILSGGPTMDRTGNCKDYVRELNLPILGICLGHQLMALAYDGDVSTGDYGGYAEVEVEIIDEDDILRGLGPRTQTWASHADEVIQLPESFTHLARSNVCEIEAMRHKDKPLFGIQWHPEVSHTEQGEELLLNFIRICQDH